MADHGWLCKVSSGTKRLRSSLSVLWYELWYDYGNILFLLIYLRRGRD